MLCDLLEDLGGLVDLHHGLVEVDNVDTVALHEDIRLHGGVPFAAKVAEMAASLQQHIKICS